MKPISNTAFYCCGVRMQDAEAANPVCGDNFAKLFMNEDGLRIHEAFKDEVNPNASNIVRHRIIDDFLRQELGANSDLQVVLIGAGFDSRAYRLTGGTWVELDEPQIITCKNERLPLDRCKNALQRIPIDFSTDSLEQKLEQFSSHAPVVVVIEGVFVYLEEDTIRHLLQTLRRLFPSHRLICDLMNRKFFEKYSRTFHEKIVRLGTKFNIKDNPCEVFIENGYRIMESTSIVGRAIELSSIKIPKILLHMFLRNLLKGYSIHVFG